MATALNCVVLLATSEPAMVYDVLLAAAVPGVPDISSQLLPPFIDFSQWYNIVEPVVPSASVIPVPPISRVAPTWVPPDIVNFPPLPSGALLALTLSGVPFASVKTVITSLDPYCLSVYEALYLIKEASLSSLSPLASASAACKV